MGLIGMSTDRRSVTYFTKPNCIFSRWLIIVRSMDIQTNKGEKLEQLQEYQAELEASLELEADLNGTSSQMYKDTHMLLEQTKKEKEYEEMVELLRVRNDIWARQCLDINSNSLLKQWWAVEDLVRKAKNIANEENQNPLGYQRRAK